MGDDDMRLLVAEDQETLRSILIERLSKEGYSVDGVANGEDALDYLEAAEYNLVILDLMMPKIDGYAVLKRIREEKNDLPVLILTAKDMLQDKIKGLDLGADDYLVKPFAFAELLARVRALLRRSAKPILDVLRVADLTIDRTNNLVKRGDETIKLSKKEYVLLEYMMIHAGEVLSRERLEQISTNFDYEGYSNVIDVYIRFLRKKIDDNHDAKLIHTIRGFGYVLRSES
jgi:DNA-binding response OmpR family regulator